MGKPRRTAGASGAITLRNLPAPVARAVREHAARYHVSLNRAVIELLEGAIGTKGTRGTTRYDDLAHLAGSWSGKIGREADAALAELRRINPEDWR